MSLLSRATLSLTRPSAAPLLLARASIRYQSSAAYELIKVSQPSTGVTQITLNRPPMNPLSSVVMKELASALQAADEDESVRAVVLTGNAKAFAAGADIKEMQHKTFVEGVSALPETGSPSRTAQTFSAAGKRYVLHASLSSVPSAAMRCARALISLTLAARRWLRASDDVRHPAREPDSRLWPA